MKIVGINIKKYREEKKISLRDMAKKLKVSASFLSQVETGKASPSLSTLKEIADFFQATVGTLVGEDQNLSDNPVVKERERKSIKHIGSGLKMYLLASPDPNKQMEPLLFKLDEKANSGGSMYKHFGQEFVIVLKGALEITLSDNKYILNKGDSIYYNSNIPHSFKNINKGLTEVIWVDTPPTF